MSRSLTGAERGNRRAEVHQHRALGKVKNSALRWLPANAAAGREGLIVIGEISLTYIKELRLWPCLYGGDPRPRFMPDTGWAVYGGYIIERFTESHPVGEATIYYSMSTWMPHQAFLMRTRLVLVH